MRSLAQPRGEGAKGAEFNPPPPRTRKKMKENAKMKMKKIFDKFYRPGKLDFCWAINTYAQAENKFNRR